MPALSLPSRRLEPEWMDDPGLDVRRHARALRGLRRINRVSRSAPTTWRAIEAATADLPRDRTLRIADIASGGGDVAIGLARRAARARRPVHVTGFDISPTAVEYASNRAAAMDLDVAFQQRDALAGPLPDGFDVLTCSLFLHHLTDERIVDLLGRMKRAAGVAVVGNDLVRSAGHLAAAHVFTRLLSRSPIVHYDGPQSVRAALTCEEATDLARRAGLIHARIERRFPQRFILTWRRP